MQDEEPAKHRPTAREIFSRAYRLGEQELKRPARELLFSGLACGFVMGLSGLGVAILRAGGVSELASYLLYPLGFAAVIVGRMQLFTENTLFPVLVVLGRTTPLRAMLKLWGVVLAANMAGAFLFGVLVIGGRAGPPPVREHLEMLGAEVAGQPFIEILVDAVIGGWLVALVAWLVSASQSVSGQLAVIGSLTYVVGAGEFDHSVAGLAEVLAAVLALEARPLEALVWFIAAVVGNVLGGVGLVSIVNFAQASGQIPPGSGEA